MLSSRGTRAGPTMAMEKVAGKAPLHTFSELEAFFKAKDQPPPAPAAPAPPAEEAPPPPPPGDAGQAPPA